MSRETDCGLEIQNSQSLSQTLTRSLGGRDFISLRIRGYMSAEILAIISRVTLDTLFGVPALRPPVFFPIAINVSKKIKYECKYKGLDLQIMFNF